MRNARAKFGYQMSEFVPVFLCGLKSAGRIALLLSYGWILRSYASMSGGHMLELKSVRMEFPADSNIIVGQSHFIKTVEDLYEAVSTTVPQAKFGLAFNEASGACLTRTEGNDRGLLQIAVKNAQALACGHTFVLVLENAYPINVLNSIRSVPEVAPYFAQRRIRWKSSSQRASRKEACLA